jgi:hypothetical protein
MDADTALILSVVCLLLAAGVWGGDLADAVICWWHERKHQRRRKAMARAIEEARLHAAVPRPSLGQDVRQGQRLHGLSVVPRQVRRMDGQPKDAA